MINYKLLFRIIGQLLFIESGFLMTCLAVSLAYGEDDSFSFLTATLTTMLVGLLARFAGRNSDNNLSRRDAYLVVTAAWMIFYKRGMKM